MKELLANIKQRFHKLGEVLKPMTPLQRLDHLWSYYKYVLVIAAVIGLIIYVAVTGIVNANIETLISGVFVNVNMPTEASAYVTDEYFAHLGGVEGEDMISVSHSYFGELTSTKEVEYSYNAAMKVIALVTAEQLDYLIADDIGFSFYLTYDIFMDLRDILTPEEMEYFADDIIYYQEEGKEKVPVALNMRNNPFYQRYLADNPNNVYFGFIANTVRKDTCRNFWDYLMALEPAK